LLLATLQVATAFHVAPRPSSSAASASSSSSILSMKEATTSLFEEEEDHLSNQAEAFDMMAPMFSRSDGLPPDTAAVVNHIAVTFLREVVEIRQNGAIMRGEAPPTKFRLLDIGCGAGVLFRFLMIEAQNLGIDLHVDGVDVSEKMIDFGKGHALNVLKDMGDEQDHSIDCYAEDFVKHLQGKDSTYDGVIANSCFANFYDTDASVRAMTQSICEDGIVCVAHPVGSAFVEGLHEFNPKVTPHLMPTPEQYDEITKPYPLTRITFQDELKWGEEAKEQTLPLYYASSVKWV
jgi:2-polyprenyl-3-methyl-5-hydroxy-6-metoxy-1,4-benzoquinol methylase